MGDIQIILDNGTYSLALLFLIGLPLVAAPIVYFTGRFFKVARWAALIAIGLAWIPFVLAAQVIGGGSITVVIGGMTLRIDNISLVLAAIALSLGTLVVLYSNRYVAHEENEDKYYAMLVALVGVMIGLGCATDLFNLWVWFEAMAISSYLLVAFYRDQPASLEAGVKYLVQSAVGSVLVLLGIALVLALTGTTNLAEIRVAAARADALPLLAAGALFMIGFGVKAALVPMHTWLPDAHSQAPSGISAMLSGVVIEAGLIALLRAVASLSGVTLSWGVLLMAFGALNMLAGNLLALRQKQVKRMLAFSSLSHMGYMLLGLGIAVYVGQSAAASGSFFHLINHGLMKGLAFLAAGALLYVLFIKTGDHHSPLTIRDLGGAARKYPIVAFTLSIAVLGLAGLPPFAGFMSKWQIFAAGVETHNVAIDLLVLFAALNSILSLAYYAPVVNAVYRQEPSDAVTRGQAMSWTMSLPLLLLAAAIVILGVWPSLLAWMTGPAGVDLVRAFSG
jgi:proton-translocating NADH-quinone oxidoreductase chain N